MGDPGSRRNNARKAAARRYQREHPGSTYAHAYGQASPAESSTGSWARSWDAGRYRAALLSSSGAVVDASARLSEAIPGSRSDADQLRLLDGATFGQWLGLKMNWLHMVGELRSGSLPMPESTAVVRRGRAGFSRPADRYDRARGGRRGAGRNCSDGGVGAGGQSTP